MGQISVERKELLSLLETLSQVSKSRQRIQKMETHGQCEMESRNDLGIEKQNKISFSYFFFPNVNVYPTRFFKSGDFSVVKIHYFSFIRISMSLRKKENNFVWFDSSRLVQGGFQIMALLIPPKDLTFAVF